jgi:hypothetical protein
MIRPGAGLTSLLELSGVRVVVPHNREEILAAPLGDAPLAALSSDTADAIADVPWRAIAGMRDRTIHRRPEVDLDVLWDTMEHDLPHLEQHIRQHLHDTTPEDAD